MEFSGEWFLPAIDGSNPKVISGTLKWSIDRALLSLNDIFKPIEGDVYGDEVYYYPAVHGVTVDSKYVSLLRASRIGSSFNFGPAGMRQSERLISSWVIVGAHVDEQTLYKELKVRIPSLELWLETAKASVSFYEPSQVSPPAFVYSAEQMPEEVFEIPVISAGTGWGINRSTNGDVSTEFTIRTHGYLRVFSETPRNFDWFLRQLGKIKTLLSFLAGGPMGPDLMSAKIADADIVVESLISLREGAPCEYRNVDHFFMLKNGMGADFGSVLSRWFELYDSVSMPSQLALSVLSSKSLWPHVEFLSLLQALEGLHRAILPGTYTSEAEYDAVKSKLSEAIPKDLPKDHKAALKSRIHYGNEISLRKRLDQLIDRLNKPLRSVILGGDGRLPQAWVDTRNYYTHWDASAKSKVLEGIDMYQANARLRMLLRVLYLDLVGISQDAVAKSLSNSSKESQYLIQINNAAHRVRNPENPGKPMYSIKSSKLGGADDFSG